MTSVTVFDFTFMKIVSTWLILNLDIVRVVVFFVTAYHMALHLIVAWLGSGTCYVDLFNFVEDSSHWVHLLINRVDNSSRRRLS